MMARARWEISAFLFRLPHPVIQRRQDAEIHIHGLEHRDGLDC
jgi:hypothetical protein